MSEQNVRYSIEDVAVGLFKENEATVGCETLVLKFLNPVPNKQDQEEKIVWGVNPHTGIKYLVTRTKGGIALSKRYEFSAVALTPFSDEEEEERVKAVNEAKSTIGYLITEIDEALYKEKDLSKLKKIGQMLK